MLNPTSWPRTDVVVATLPGGTGVAEPDVVVRVAAAGSRRRVFVKDVPACGYRVLKLGPAQPAGRDPSRIEGNVIESRFYRVTFDPATGGIMSILDKESGRELVDPKAPYRLNQYLYVAGGKGTRIVENGPEPKLKISTPQKATLRRCKLGDLGEMMIVETSAA